jgi:hypothetical protein
MKRILLLGPAVFVTALALAGCDHDRDDQPPPPPPPPPSTPADVLKQLERDGKLPTLDRSPSVAGPDANGNGVRDDIDTYIQQRFADPAQRAAAVQIAKAMQGALLADITNAEASATASRHISNAVHCLYSRFPDTEGANAPAAVGNEIEAITANTKPRLLAYLAFNKALDGTTSSLPKGDTCE